MIIVLMIIAFVTIYFYQHRKIIHLQRQLQYDYQRLNQTVMSSVGMPKFEPTPIYELSTLSHNTSRQNLVI